ncbi:abortive infection family protein [Paludibaculum fermentans]|uniref:abortive infection family protein n=1 Tax=Paludibaculum fermentans TaxID=1473598 RepID=UPI003EBF9648
MGIVLRPFSKRHEKALFVEKSIKVSLPGRLRRRIWRLLCNHNYEFAVQLSDDDNWRGNSDVLDEAIVELTAVYGWDVLKIRKESGQWFPAKTDRFVSEAFPAQVLDLLEAFHAQLGQQASAAFQRDLNETFEQESCNWRMADGRFFQVDSEFVEKAVIEPTHELLSADGFDGAQEEFREARSDLESGDHKGAILNACKSFESALKVVTNRQEGNAATLIREFITAGFCDDLQNSDAKSMESVFMALPTLRNKLGGHGQGQSAIRVPRPYAELAIQLAGTYIQFVVKEGLRKQQAVKNPGKRSKPKDDDIPF